MSDVLRAIGAAPDAAGGPDVGLPSANPSNPIADAARDPLRSGARFDDNVGVLLPGPFQACLPDVLAAGAQPLWRPAVRDLRQ